MKNRFRILQVVPVLLLLACGTLGAVTFGQPDGNAHPWVGTLLFQAGDGAYYSCSGTLLSATIMVTAAHCTIDGGILNVATWVKFSPVISFDDRKKGETLTHYLDNANHGWIKADVFPHPMYAGRYPDTYDVGVVKLSKAADVSTFGALPPLWFLNTIRQSADNSFTVVGFGMQGYIKPFNSDIWARYNGEVRLVELKSTFDGADMSAKFSNNPGSTSGGSCYGDSGGPVFYANSTMITAVVSWGITPCIGVDYNFRLDTPVAQNFVRPFLTNPKNK